jgi:hypothetical protein
MNLCRLFVPLICAVLLISCGGSSSSGGFDYVVDVATGEDSNPGTAANPFKTITRAISVAASGERIKVRSGLYNVGSGEVFPLLLPAGAELIGNEETIGLDTMINGGAFWPLDAFEVDPLLTALVASDGVFAGFSINSESDVDSVALYVDGDRVQVRNNTITAAAGAEYSEGVVVASGGNQRLIGNTLDSNTGAGLLFAGAGNDAVVEDNIITRNETGVLVTGATDINIDLGGGSQGSAGGNVLSCNGLANLRVWKGSYDASNNFWDHVPPTRSPPDEFPAEPGEFPVDIAWSIRAEPAPTITTGNDQLAFSPCAQD